MARQVRPGPGVKTSPGPAKRSMIPSSDSSCSRPANTMHLVVLGIRGMLGKGGKIGDLGTCFCGEVLVRYLRLMMNHRCSKSSSVVCRSSI